MHKDPDTQLMLDFKAGDQTAFQRLFNRYRKPVINYCFRFCGNFAVPEELAQEAFLRVYKAASRYQPKAKFRTWLYKIATNVCLNEMRKAVYRAQMEPLDPNNAAGAPKAEAMVKAPEMNRPDAMLECLERNTMVLKAVGGLPEKQRAALLLRINESFSYREIGAQIDCSESQVKTLIHRGRQRLKTMMESYWGVNHE